MASRNVELIIRAKDDATKAFRSVNAALEELAAIQKQVAAGSTDMADALAKGETSAGGMADALSKETGAAATKAKAAYERVTAAVDKARARFKAQKAELAESEAAFRALKAQTAAAAEAIERMRAKIGPFNDGFNERLKAAERQYGVLTRQVRKLAPAIARQQQELEAAAENLSRIENAAGAAAIAMRQFEADQRRIALGDSVSAQENLARALREVESRGRITAADQRRLAKAFRETAAQAERLRPSLRNVLREMARLGPEADRTARGMIRGAQGATNMRIALRAFYGDSRRALSLMQRIRGEVLSLTASFVGFYGVFRTGSSFLEAFQELQAAENRFGAAFQQNAQQVSGELALIRSEAERLGFSFGVLADNYSKFLISAQAAGLETAKTRKIFIQVSEAARVLKLSNEQVSGVLTAMSQIAGKGTLQMEELRQQIGDRIPGAVGIMAKALGYGEDRLGEFYKAVQQGQIGAEEALVALGQGLEETYGGQLDSALESVTARIGQFQNLLFSRQLTAANSGFIQGLETALEALNKFLASEQGIRFFEALGAAFGKLFELLPGVLEHFNKLIFAVKVFAAIKIAQVVSGLVGTFGNVTRASFGARRAMVQMNRVLLAASPAFARAVVSATRYGAALRGLRQVLFSVIAAGRALILSVGGPIGAVVTALSFFALDSIGSVDENVSALNKTLSRHREIVQALQGAYLAAGEGAQSWKEKLQDLTEIEVAANLERLRKQLYEFRSDWKNTLNTIRGSAPETRALLYDRARNDRERQLVKDLLAADAAFNQGEISAKKFLEAIERVREAAPDMLPVGVLESFVKIAKQGLELENSIAEAEAVLRLMNGTATEADKVLLGLAEATEEVAQKGVSVTKAYEGFEAALRELARNIPSLKAELDRFDSIAKIEQQFQAALKAARALPDEIMRVAAAQEALARRQEALNGVYQQTVSGYGGSNPVQVAAQFIRDREGFRATPYWDVNAYRAGFGSDTVTLSDGSVRAVTEGIRVSIEDANRDLLRRITEEFLPRAKNQVGAERFDTLNAQQRAALVSIAYNYGELPARIVEAIRSGTDQQVAEAIRALGSDNGGVNRERRNMEAALFTSTAGYEAAIQADQRRVELAREFREQLERRIADAEFELSLQDKALQDAEVAKAIRQAELEAQKAGVELTKEQRAEIERVTRAKFASQAAEEARNEALKKARSLEEEVTRLQERRRFLEEQAAYQQEQGDLAGLASTTGELESVNAALDEAIRRAIAFWEALGGEGSVAAIQALRQTQAELNRTSSTAVVTGQQINEMFAGAVASAIDRFSRRVAEGEDALTAFREEFLRMAGEILIQLAQMIIKQAIFNALAGATGGGFGGVGGGVAGLINGLFRHGGGVVNGTGRTGLFDSRVFANAYRYHGGGVAGLAPDEVPAILRQGEEVLTESDPRHRFNGGLTRGAAPQVKIVNAIDGTDALDQALSTGEGEELILNFMRRNADAVKAALG